MNRNFNSTFVITIQFNSCRKKSLVLAFGDQTESARFFLELEDHLTKLVEQARSAHRSLLVPISLVPDKIPTEGLKVRFRYGECFGENIEWNEVEIGTLVYQHDINPNGECGVLIREVGGYGFAGYDDRTKTYWRYRDEAQGEVYREHCLQVLEVL